jgi:hypothetical protein
VCLAEKKASIEGVTSLACALVVDGRWKEWLVVESYVGRRVGVGHA